MRIAAIDIGTNSVHMIVVRVRPDLSFEVIDREKAMVRLGAGGLDGKALTTEAMSAALQALSKFKRLAESHTVDVILAAATSATREARNGGEFLARIEAETGIRPRVITGAEEARLIHLAAVYGVDVGSARAVVIDIGGGSTEITLGTATSIQAAKSFKIGVIRLTERFVKSDPLSGRDEQKLTKHVLSEIDRHCEQITAAGFDRVIGTSGTILSLGTVATAIAEGTVPSELRNLRVPAKADSTTAQGSGRALARTATDHSRTRSTPRRPDRRRRRTARCDPAPARRRGHHAVRSRAARGAGARLHPSQQQAHQARRQHPRCATAQLARTGRAVQLLRRPCSTGGPARAGDLRSDARRPRLDRPRARVARVRGTAARHRRPHQLRAPSSSFVLPDPEWRSARLRSRTRSRSSRSSPGITGEARRSGRTRNTPRLPSPLRRTVRTLASILRVAESLDRSHTQTISGLDFRDRGDDALLQVHTTGDAELEVWATNRHLQPFERILGKPVRLESGGRAIRTAEPRASKPVRATARARRHDARPAQRTHAERARTPDQRSRNTDLTPQKPV